MLNTDLHNESQKNKMSKSQFIERNQMVCNDKLLTAEQLGKRIAHVSTPLMFTEPSPSFVVATPRTRSVQAQSTTAY